MSYDTVSSNKNLYVKINNYGLVTAKKIEIYFDFPGKDFDKFSSIPFINGTISTNSNKLDRTGIGLFYIPALAAETNITAWVNLPLTPGGKITVYV